MKNSGGRESRVPIRPRPQRAPFELRNEQRAFRRTGMISNGGGIRVKRVVQIRKINQTLRVFLSRGTSNEAQMKITATETKGTPAEIILPCGSSKLSSSRGLGWTGFAVESHQAYAAPAEESYFPDIILELASGNCVAYGERSIGHGRFKPYSKLPGSINVYAEGVRPALHPTTTTDLIVCAFDPTFVADVQGELSLPASTSLQGQLGFSDPAIAHLVKLLEVESREGQPTGRFYAEHLIYAVTARLLTLGRTTEQVRFTKWGMPKPRLARVIEKMKSDLCASHNLDHLALESGYSRNHFLRMFRDAMQCTPHRYLLRLRVEKAQSLMKDRSLRLTDIAAECGFSSQAQLSKTFKQLVGITPNEYRHARS